MISDSHTRYGSRVFCQGRLLRPCAICQRTISPEKPESAVGVNSGLPFVMLVMLVRPALPAAGSTALLLREWLVETANGQAAWLSAALPVAVKKSGALSCGADAPIR